MDFGIVVIVIVVVAFRFAHAC